MNILMVGPHKDKVQGGISTVINEYTTSKYLKEFNIENIHTVIPGNKIKKILYGLNSMAIMIYFLAFKNIDIVHIHTASGKSFFRKSIFINLSKKFNKKVILHIHGGAFEEVYLSSNKKHKNKISESLNKCDKIIVLSESWKNKVKNMTNSEIVVVNNSIESKKENLYNIKSKNIIFIGRIEKDKGIFDFLEMAKEVSANNKNIDFIICGDGNLDEVSSKIKAYNLEDRVKTLGWISKNQIEEQLKKSMIFTLPSYKEAMPMSILEAMNLGVPIISTNVGSIPEVIEDNINGKLFTPGNIKGFIKNVEDMISNENQRKEYSENSFNIIKEKYSNKYNHQKIKEVYKTIDKNGN